MNAEHRGEPILRWAGSKRYLLEELALHSYPNFTRYVEPFAGSACLFFRLAPQSAILGDNNIELINLYRCVRKSPVRLHRRLVALTRDEATYLRWRGYDPQFLDPETRALRFLYLNRNCFNGIYRTNRAGQFNVPRGSRLAKTSKRSTFVECARSLRKVHLIPGDFETTLQHVARGDFVYLDPPFALTTRRVFNEYGQNTFSTDDVPRLTAQLRRISRLGARFLVSYADCPQARELAREWFSRKLLVRRNVSGFIEHRTKAFEWLISNYQVAAR